LKKHYAYPELAQRMANELTAHQKSGQYAELDAPTFADLLTDQMRHISHDQHLELVYSVGTLHQPHERTPEEAANLRQQLRQENCEFEKVAMLRHHIGYVKLNFFADASECSSTAAAAMTSVNHANAIIFDLRDNRGGDPAMVSLMAAYLFDHPEFWYNPRENTTRDSWTHSPVKGNLLADKPVYILTSNRTFSGAEQFCYDLKMLKRATLVGETTGGGAHAGVWHRIDDHFGVAIPEVKPINPYSQPDWEGTGVEPDVNVKPADALEAAVKLAESRSKKN
jgi:C-terminal processing protease CtpA/Prc